MVPLSPDTLARIETLFSPEHHAEVRALLESQCANNLPFCECSDMFALERLRFAVLKLANGDLRRLHEAIELAKLDWRDTLLAAGFGEDVNTHREWFPRNYR